MKRTFPAKLMLAALLCAPIISTAQKKKELPPPLHNWQNLDLKTDGQFGMSTERAYKELLAGKPHVPVVVAIIDGGIDTNHIDLKRVLWTNHNEVAGNQTDDDKNGYADDMRGWNFIGSAKGDVQYDNLELIRLLRRDMQKYKYADTKYLSKEELAKYNKYQEMDLELNKKIDEAQKNAANINSFRPYLNAFLRDLGSDNPSKDRLVKYFPESMLMARVKRIIYDNWKEGSFEDFRRDEIDEPYKYSQDELNYHLNLNFDSRDTVGDNYANSAERFYGNNDVMGPDADHGTHVAGIIGADRTNNEGVMGVADDVQLMMIRTVPNGDERDKDVASAIRYAAANGAKVINMSFGKDYSYDKKAVDEAVKFAMTKDVLLVHAAGNDGKDNDVKTSYPNRVYEDGSGTAAGWLEVGASGYIDNNELKASFSNYGKTTVDVFAPGVKIQSTAPGSKYRYHDGTSMAAPMVAGVAALIRSYYPKLTAVQVKDIIMKTVTKVDHSVKVKQEKSSKSMGFDDLCITGGIVNAYEALKLAATY